jgi:hypothetical protein
VSTFSEEGAQISSSWWYRGYSKAHQRRIIMPTQIFLHSQ